MKIFLSYANTRDFQIQIYEPAMLIVGTRGRSLGGFQGLVSNRNSFSKWCLQYSPVPVVVVRPTEKRLKKKKKRDADPTRQDYARIIKESGLDEHETDGGDHNSIFEVANDQKQEAHAVAAALGLPAAFDPTLKPIQKESSKLRKVESGQSTGTQGSLSPDSRPTSPEVLLKSPKSNQLESPAMSGEESSEGEDDDEGEFETVDARTLLNNSIPEIERKKKLHEMEVGEAQALFHARNNSVASNDSAGSQPSAVAADDAAEEESPERPE
jgi:hypothetical protein